MLEANAKRSKVRRAMEAAYGVTQRTEGVPLDDSRAAEAHIVSIQPGLEGRPLLQTTFEKALEELVERLLEHRWPQHPRFATLVTTAKLRKVLEQVERTLAAPDRRVPLESKELRLMRELAEPLGVLSCGESAVNLNARRLEELDQRRRQAGIASPTVADMRGLLDPHGVQGFEREVQDLLVAAFAAWSGRTIERAGVVVDPAAGKSLPDDAVLRQVELPSESEWTAALERAGHLFGITRKGKVLTPASLAEVVGEVLQRVEAIRSAAVRLPETLGEKLRSWHASLDAPRMVTARSGAELLRALREDLGPAEVIRQLASFDAQTSPQALARSLATAAKNVDALNDRATWALLDQVGGLGDVPQVAHRAQRLVADLQQKLQADELNVALESELDRLAGTADEILRDARPTEPGRPKAPPGWVAEPELVEVTAEASGPEQLVERLAESLRDQLRYQGADDGRQVRLEGKLTLYRKVEE